MRNLIDSSAGEGALLVEDEPGIVDFVRRGLEAEGFEVWAALDGVEGQRLALKGGSDAIILHLMLPGRTGASSSSHQCKLRCRGCR